MTTGYLKDLDDESWEGQRCANEQCVTIEMDNCKPNWILQCGGKKGLKIEREDQKTTNNWMGTSNCSLQIPSAVWYESVYLWRHKEKLMLGRSFWTLYCWTLYVRWLKDLQSLPDAATQAVWCEPPERPPAILMILVWTHSKNSGQTKRRDFVGSHLLPKQSHH